MKSIASLALALSLASGPATARQDPAPIREFDVETIEALGRAIYDQDRFAWVGTDALLAAVPPERLEGLVGWIVVEREGADTVRFGRGDMADPEPFYDVAFRGDADPVVAAATGRFAEYELSMFRAAALARNAVTQPCSDRYNVVVLPDVDADGWLVWAFAATTEPDVVVAGGHYRFTVSADGRTLERSDRLSIGCLTISGPPPRPAGSEWLALTTTTLLSSTPLESHVFISLSHEINLYVMTSDQQVWLVEGDETQRLEDTSAFRDVLPSPS